MVLKKKAAAGKYPEQSADIMIRLLLEPVDLKIGDSTQRVTALKAIMMQLFHQQIAGNTRAHALLTRFSRFLPQGESIEIIFGASNADS